MAAPERPAPSRWLKPAVLIGALGPLAWLCLSAALGRLGSRPIPQARNALGLTALIFLIASLACSPAKVLLGWTWPARIRRPLGVYAFVYAVLHLLVYVVLNQKLDPHAIYGGIARRHVIMGVLAFLLMAPLALTSTDASVRRLGYTRWKRLHRLAYVAGGLGVLHFYWRLTRDHKDPTEAMIYGLVLALLLSVRLVDAIRRSRKKSRPSAVA